MGGASQSCRELAAAAGATENSIVDIRCLPPQARASVLDLIGEHPTVKAQHGNPRKLIELASRFAPGADVLPSPPLSPLVAPKVGLQLDATVAKSEELSQMPPPPVPPPVRVMVPLAMSME